MSKVVDRKTSRSPRTGHHPKFILDQQKPTKPMQIIYHGTRNKANAKSIVKNGFRPSTYFAIHQEDALGYGGNYLFEVAYESDKIPKGVDWEFCNNKVIPPSAIVSLTQYHPAKKLIEDEVLRNKVFESNIPQGSSEGIPKTSKVRIERVQTKPKPERLGKHGYSDRKGQRVSRKHHKGFKKIKY